MVSEIDLVGAVFETVRRRENNVLLEALRYHLAPEGSYSRARIALHAASSLGMSKGNQLALAASVESLHNASLIQDDLQDKSHYRRNQPAVWLKFGESTAVGLTDLLLSAAYKVLGRLSRTYPLPELLTCIHEAIEQTLRGQCRDLKKTARYTIADCLDIAAEKSGPLFALALKLPLIATGNEVDCEKAHEAAVHFGVGYQVFDDICDYEVDRKSNNPANLVLILEKEMSLPSALDEARRIANSNLLCAKRVASTLPHNSGCELERLTLCLKRKLLEASHA